jgi:hypothetical protein
MPRKEEKEGRKEGPLPSNFLYIQKEGRKEGRKEGKN